MEERKGTLWLKLFGESLGFRFVMLQAWAEDRCCVCQQRTGPIWYVAVQPAEDYSRLAGMGRRLPALKVRAKLLLLDGQAVCSDPACQTGRLAKITSQPDVITVSD